MGVTTLLCDRDLLKGIGQFLLLPLHLLLLKKLGITRLRVVNTALGLVLSLPATRSLILASSYWLSRVPVTDALVASLQEVVVRNIVGINILLDLSEGPVSKRVDLDEASLVNLNDVQVSSLSALAASSASQDSLDLEFRIGALGRLNLGNVVVELVVGVPQLVAVLRGEVVNIVATSRLVNVDGSSISSSNSVNKSICFVEVVQSVQEDQVDVVLQRSVKLRQHVNGHKTGKTESCGLEETR